MDIEVISHPIYQELQEKNYDEYFGGRYYYNTPREGSYFLYTLIFQALFDKFCNTEVNYEYANIVYYMTNSRGFSEYSVRYKVGEITYIIAQLMKCILSNDYKTTENDYIIEITITYSNLFKVANEEHYPTLSQALKDWSQAIVYYEQNNNGALGDYIEEFKKYGCNYF